MVDDTIALALQDLAVWARREWRGDVVAAAPCSAGKTTTKDVIAEMLATEMATAKTRGNLNNHVGLPLFRLLRLEETWRAWRCLEIGMNHAGEIRDLAAHRAPRRGSW